MDCFNSLILIFLLTMFFIITNVSIGFQSNRIDKIFDLLAKMEMERKNP
jgi:hypothetical protein